MTPIGASWARQKPLPTGFSRTHLDDGSELTGCTQSPGHLGAEAHHRGRRLCTALERSHPLNRHDFADVVLYDDVLPVLAELRRNHQVGLLSNGNSYPKRLGLEDCFQATVLSQDHSVEKPDRRIFDIASALLPGEPQSWSATRWPMTSPEPKRQADRSLAQQGRRRDPESRPRPCDPKPARTSPHGECTVTPAPVGRSLSGTPRKGRAPIARHQLSRRESLRIGRRAGIPESRAF